MGDDSTRSQAVNVVLMPGLSKMGIQVRVVFPGFSLVAGNGCSGLTGPARPILQHRRLP